MNTRNVIPRKIPKAGLIPTNVQNMGRKGVIVIGCPDGKKAIKLFRGVENETGGD